MPKTLGRVAYAYAPKASVLGSSRDTVVTNVLAMDLLAMDLQHGKEVGDWQQQSLLKAGRGRNLIYLYHKLQQMACRIKNS